MPAALVLAALVLAAPVAPGPLPPDGPVSVLDAGLRITIDADGLYEIRPEDLRPFVDPAAIRPSALELLCDGAPLPIHVRGEEDDRFDPGDGIVFFGRANRSAHSRSGVYVLRHGGSRVRIPRAEAPAGPGPVLEEGLRRFRIEHDDYLVPGRTVNEAALRTRGLPAWIWKPVPPGGRASFVIDLDPPPRPNEGGTLRIEMAGALREGIPRKIRIRMNGRDCGEHVPEGFPIAKVEIRLPPSSLESRSLLEIENVSGAATWTDDGNEIDPEMPNDVHVDAVEVVYPCLLIGPDTDGAQIHYALDTAPLPEGAVLSFVSRLRSGWWLYDVTGSRFIDGRRAGRGGGDAAEFVVCGYSGARRPAAIAAMEKPRLRALTAGADLLIVTLPRFRDGIEPLARHRRSRGLVTEVVTTREIYDEFNHGRFAPAAIQGFIRRAARTWERKPRFVLLVGDADLDVEFISKHEVLPAFTTRTSYNGVTGTDHPYALVDDDDRPDLAVGRLPVRREDDLVRLVDRIIAYERDVDGGDWRRRIGIIAAEAGFGAQVDALLESFARASIAKAVPEPFRVDVAYSRPGSPYYIPPARFPEHVARTLSGRAVAVTYLGHGSERALGPIRHRGRRFPVFAERDIASVDAGPRPPILTLICCYAGAFDSPSEDCIAEELLRRPGGPIAVIASTRISHPLANAAFGDALLPGFFAAGRPIGETLREAKLRLLDGKSSLLVAAGRAFLSKSVDPDRLFREHLELYNLLGDPALVPALPDPLATLAADGAAAPGAVMRIHGTVSSGSGRAVISLERPHGRGRPDRDAVESAPDGGVPDRSRTRGDAPLLEVEAEIRDGTFAADVTIPADIEAGRFLVKVHADLGRVAAAGAVEIRIAR